MLILSSTTDNLQVVLGGAVTTNQLRCVSSWRDITTTTFTPGRTVTNTNNTTDVNIVPSPAASTQRVVDLVNIYNSDTVSATVTIKFDDSGTEYILWSGLLLPGQTIFYQEGIGWNVSNGSLGYTVALQYIVNSPTDAQTVFFGNIPVAPTTTANTRKVFVPTAGNVVAIDFYTQATGTAGTAEAWALSFRLNNTTDTAIATVSLATAERRWTNFSLSIPVIVGDYFEMKAVNPTWATNPTNVVGGGYVYIV